MLRRKKDQQLGSYSLAEIEAKLRELRVKKAISNEFSVEPIEPKINKRKLFQKKFKSESVHAPKHRAWLVVSISFVVLALAFLLFYSPTREAVFGKAISLEGDPNLILYWKFDGDKTTAVLDSSSFGHTVNYNDKVLFSSQFGLKGGNIFPTNDISSSFLTNEATGLDLGENDFAVSFWLTRDGWRTGDSPRVILGHTNGLSGLGMVGWQLSGSTGAQGSKIILTLNDDGGKTPLSFVGVDNISTLGWHHLVMVVDRQNDLASVFIDNRLDLRGDISSLTGSLTHAGPFGLGGVLGHTFGGTYYDEVMYFSRALQLEEIMALFQSRGRTQICGDGELDLGEECDDHNKIDWDGCSSSCRVERLDQDDDQDGVLNGEDNCPTLANPGQENWDREQLVTPINDYGDELGDACDPDDDNDGLLDGQDDVLSFDQDNDEICDGYAELGSFCRQGPDFCLQTLAGVANIHGCLINGEECAISYDCESRFCENNVCVAGNVLDQSLKLYLKFEDDGGSRFKTWDFSGQGHHAGSNGSIQWLSDSGLLNTGTYYFDGVDDVLFSPSKLIENYPFTLVSWVKPEVDVAFNYGNMDGKIFSLHNFRPADLGYSGFSTQILDGKARIVSKPLNLGDESATEVNSVLGPLIADGNWHQIVGVYTASNDRALYVDGLLKRRVTTRSTSPNLDELNYYAVGGPTLRKGDFKGMIDEVMVYDRALLEQEIFSLYQKVLLCGNSVLNAGEECDDGGNLNGDGCRNDCTIDYGFYCSSQPSACESRCGDLKTASNEVCDDGDIFSGDGCTADCSLVEEGWICSKSTATCSTICGDGFTKGLEQCDDGNKVDGDGCSSQCLWEGECQIDRDCGEQEVCIDHACSFLAVCGNGLTEGMEACDDRNQFSGDGCTADCSLVEEGWICSKSTATCSTICGDGFTKGLEQCDDGNNVDGDGCSDECVREFLADVVNVQSELIPDGCVTLEDVAYLADKINLNFVFDCVAPNGNLLVSDGDAVGVSSEQKDGCVTLEDVSVFVESILNNYVEACNLN